ncbi:DNA-binding domain-containing protein [Clostridium oceanicum]|uniref:Stage 0 sporulation protein A homolog n=1 Tax=Clostridium oceanicum TaxID=1543 RepID=A0ABN1JUN0_9CLOT
MKIMIIDDDIAIIKMLQKIIADRNLGEVEDFATNGIEGKIKIKKCNPDIVLVDLLMKKKDGITMVKEIKKENQYVQFIMISKILCKSIIGKAYKSGIEYYINKPINALEVENVIKKVSEKVVMSRKLRQIENTLLNCRIDPALESKNNNFKKYNEEVKDNINLDDIKKIMSKIGIMGKLGYEDILKMVEYLSNKKEELEILSIKDLCLKFTKSPKSMEQRMRRAAYSGLVNLANLGIEDYMNLVFEQYSNTLYDFQQVRIEMNHIRGKNKKRGKVDLKKFILGLLYYSENT